MKRFLVFFCLGVSLLSGCGRSDDNQPPQDKPAPPADDGNNSPASGAWGAVKREIQLDGTRPPGCNRHTIEMLIHTDGSFKHERCGSEVGGVISSADLAALNEAASAVAAGDLNAKACTTRSPAAKLRTQVQLTDGRLFPVWEESLQGTCTHGDPANAARLQQLMTDLQEKYVITLPPLPGPRP